MLRLSATQNGWMPSVAVQLRIRYADRATAHGFRSTFRTWATERTKATQRAKKLSTAHKVGDDIEGAYDRALVVDERRELMERWGCHVTGRPFPSGD